LAEIRPARTGDVDAVVGLWLQLAKTHERLDERFKLVEKPEVIWRNHILSVMENPDCRVVVAVEDGVVVGFANGSVGKRPPFFAERIHGDINDLYVDESHRRRGIGTRLVESLLQWFRARGITSYQAQFYTRNKAAKAFWSRIGFQGSMHKVVRHEHCSPKGA